MNNAFSYLGEMEPDKGNLIKGLQLIQTREGYVSNDGILAAAEHFGIPAAEVEGVLTFYAQFKRTKPGKYKLSVCDGTACHIKGSTQIRAWVSAELGINDGETTEDGLFTLDALRCIGACGIAPAVSINGKVYPKVAVGQVEGIIDSYRQEAKA